MLFRRAALAVGCLCLILTLAACPRSTPHMSGLVLSTKGCGHNVAILRPASHPIRDAYELVLPKDLVFAHGDIYTKGHSILGIQASVLDLALVHYSAKGPPKCTKYPTLLVTSIDSV